MKKKKSRIDFLVKSCPIFTLQFKRCMHLENHILNILATNSK